MYKNILNIMYCPICKEKFTLEENKVEEGEVIEGILTCDKGHRYGVHKGIVDFYSEEQSIFNQWSEEYRKIDYEDLDKKIESSKSDKEKEQDKMVIDTFIFELSKMDNGYNMQLIVA